MLGSFVSAFRTVKCAQGLLRRVLADAGREQGAVTIVAGLAAVMATAVTASTLTVATGDQVFGNLEDLVGTSIARVSGTIEIRGSIVARSEDGLTLTTVEIPVRFYGEGSPVSFADNDPERMTIAYFDDGAYVPNIPYTVEFVGGNGDALLDPWETALIKIDLASLDSETDGLHGSERFTLEIQAPMGGIVRIDRRLPPILQPVMNLN